MGHICRLPAQGHADGLPRLLPVPATVKPHSDKFCALSFESIISLLAPHERTAASDAAAVAHALAARNSGGGDSPEGAAIILTLVFVGVIGLVLGLTWVFLKGGLGSPRPRGPDSSFSLSNAGRALSYSGQPKRQMWCRDHCCCCCSGAFCFRHLDDANYKNAVVLNGYGEVMAPPPKAEIDKTMWAEALDETGRVKAISPEEAIRMMTMKAQQKGPLVQLQAPDSVLALTDAPLVDGEDLRESEESERGLKVAKNDDDE